MRTLLILRHGKSSWNKPGLRDFDRPLNARGRGAASIVGGYIADQALVPDLILCSPAARARETLELATARFATVPEVRFVDTIYGASAPDLRREIRGHGGDVATLMMIGHNPAFHALALALAGEGNSGDLSALATKFPTAGLAVLDFEFTFWRDLEPGAGRLRKFIVPKDLAG